MIFKKLKKFIQNGFVIVISGIPNLIITLSTIAITTTIYHMNPVIAYVIGQIFSVSYSSIYGMIVKSNFKIWKWKYHFDE